MAPEVVVLLVKEITPVDVLEAEFRVELEPESEPFPGERLEPCVEIIVEVVAVEVVDPKEVVEVMVRGIEEVEAVAVELEVVALVWLTVVDTVWVDVVVDVCEVADIKF